MVATLELINRYSIFANLQGFGNAIVSYVLENVFVVRV